MLKSDQINELATALSKAQSKFETAKKSESNPYYNSKYADIAALLNVIQEPMAENGLSIVQLPRTDIAAQTVTIETVLCHSSGQWIAESYSVPAVSSGQGGRVKFDAQSIGSAITYARRYALQAFLCLAAEDDDGNSISVPAVSSGQGGRVKFDAQSIGSAITYASYDKAMAIEVEPQAAEVIYPLPVVKVVDEKSVPKKRGPKPKSSVNGNSEEPVNLPDKTDLHITNDDLPFLPSTLKVLDEDREPTGDEKKSFASELLLYAEKIDRGSLKDFFLNLAKVSEPRDLSFNNWVVGFNKLAEANGDVEKLKEIVKGENVSV